MASCRGTRVTGVGDWNSCDFAPMPDSTPQNRGQRCEMSATQRIRPGIR